MSNFRTGAIAMLAEKLLKMASQLGTMILLARFLGPADLGSLMYCYALASIFIFLNNFGLNSLLVKWMAEEPDRSSHFLKHAFVLRMAAAIISVVLTNLAGLWLVDDSARILLLLISLYHLLMPISIVEWYFQSQGKAVLSAYGLIAGSLLGFAIRAIALLADADILWLGAAYSLELIAVALVYAVIWSKARPDGNAGVSRHSLMDISKQALPLLLSGAVIMLYMRIDQLMLGYMVGDEEVGIYSAAVRLSEAWYFVGLTILGVYFPRFLHVRQSQGEEAYLDSIVRVGRVVVWGAVLLAVATTVISDWLIDFLYGSEFSAASDVLVVSIWAVMFVYLGVISSQMYVADGMLKLQLYRSLFALFGNIFLNWTLIPMFGAVGAVFSLLVAQIFAGVLINILFCFGFSRVLFLIFLPVRKRVGF